MTWGKKLFISSLFWPSGSSSASLIAEERRVYCWGDGGLLWSSQSSSCTTWCKCLVGLRVAISWCIQLTAPSSPGPSSCSLFPNQVVMLVLSMVRIKSLAPCGAGWSPLGILGGRDTDSLSSPQCWCERISNSNSSPASTQRPLSVP